MRINLHEKRLYTDNGELLKDLRCPLKIQASQLGTSEGKISCSACKEEILDTALYSDHELLELMRREPEQCLKVNLNQSNLTLI